MMHMASQTFTFHFNVFKIYFIGTVHINKHVCKSVGIIAELPQLHLQVNGNHWAGFTNIYIYSFYSCFYSKHLTNEQNQQQKDTKEGGKQ